MNNNLINNNLNDLFITNIPDNNNIKGSPSTIVQKMRGKNLVSNFSLWMINYQIR